MLSNKYIGYWLWLGVFMVWVQFLLGGITRLTGSGLSITEWNIIMGVLPPLNANEWQLAFEKYKLIPQFKLVNASMTLSEFKWIFFWEWFHRLWARTIALVFIVPFLFFLYKKYLNSKLIKQLAIAFGLGALQGLVGWLMVKSGLQNNIYVAHTKLMQHFILACILWAYLIYIAILWGSSYVKTSTDMAVPKRSVIILLILVLLQLTYGALMAGQHAALDFPSYPLMQGKIIPNNIWNNTLPFYANILDHKPMIQLIHRYLPWLIVAYVLYLKFKYEKLWRATLGLEIINAMVVVIFIQVALGITTLILSASGRIPVLWGVLHQSFGLIFWGLCVVLFILISKYIIQNYRT